MKIIPEDQLRNSPVVANCRMNRKRQLVGINSYAKELGFDPGKHLMTKSLNMGKKIRWLDLCCGEGNALVGLGQRIAGTAWEERLDLTGVDLVGMFVPLSDEKPLGLNLVESALEDWTNPHEYDLITCIHGLHYLGDKLGALRRIGLMLRTDGEFFGSFSPGNILNEAGKPLAHWMNGQFKDFGWTYSARRHLLSRNGWIDWPQNWTYIGADDQAGPNYTGQEAVNSYYRI